MERNKNEKSFNVGKIAKAFKEAHEDTIKKGKEIYESLSPEERCDLMAYIFKVLYEHLENPGSYRYLLYERLGLPLEAYVMCQMSGALEIHNILVEASEKFSVKAEENSKDNK